MSEQPLTIWRCPRCNRPVMDEERWTEAEAGQDAAGFSRPDAHRHDNGAWGGRVRFHAGHYREWTGDRFYRLVTN
jgi:hypothetical protein